MDTTKKKGEKTQRPARQEAPRQPRPKTQEPRKQPVKQAAPRSEAQRAPQERKKTPVRQAEEKRTAAQTPKSREQGKAVPKSRPQQSKKPRKEIPDDLSSKKRAYGNSKPKKKSAIASFMESGKERREKRRKQQEAQGKRQRPQQPTPAVIYTQPQPFNRSRLLIQLITVTAVVVAFVVGMSLFFKVGKITVSGADVYKDWNVMEVSGIRTGDNLLTFSRARAGALIKANLPYVKNVSFGIKLPDTVNIIIEEEDVVYAIRDQDQGWWLINSNGHIVTQGDDNAAKNYTQILGVAIDHPLENTTAVAVEAVPVVQPTADPTAATEEIPIPAVPTVSGAQRLEIALDILHALEENDIVGDAASINVAQPQSLTLWYGSRYQVNLGDTANLDYKIATMNDVILKLSDYQSGILDLSFTIFPDKVVYTPFS